MLLLAKNAFFTNLHHKITSLLVALLAPLLYQDLHGCSCLFRAVMKDRLNTVEYLAEKEPSLIDEPDNEGRTPLWIACHEGNNEMVECLISKGADLERKGGDPKMTPLWIASTEGKGKLSNY